MNPPQVSVVMAVYNGERYLREAVESILNQTFNDFELIIVNDGSTDRTPDILSRYQRRDARVFVHHQENGGQAAALNVGCHLAKGRYIARIDGDDIAFPERLERQISYLEENSHVALLGASINTMDVMGRTLSTISYPTDEKVIREWLFDLHVNPFAHVTAVFRTSVFRNVNGYRTAFAPAEDYDLWVRIAERWPVSNLAEYLVSVRMRSRSISSSNIRQQQIGTLAAWAASVIRRAGGLDPVCQEQPVSRDLLRSMGVSDAIIEQYILAAYCYWISALLQGGDDTAALQLICEAMESRSRKHADESIEANLWLALAGIHYRQSHRLAALGSVARAIWNRPAVAVRPLKRAAVSFARKFRGHVPADVGALAKQ
jgi:Glycosyl transferase family 2